MTDLHHTLLRSQPTEKEVRGPEQRYYIVWKMRPNATCPEPALHHHPL